jgi:hypothetical protein
MSIVPAVLTPFFSSAVGAGMGLVLVGPRFRSLHAAPLELDMIGWELRFYRHAAPDGARDRPDRWCENQHIEFKLVALFRPGGNRTTRRWTWSPRRSFFRWDSGSCSLGFTAGERGRTAAGASRGAGVAHLRQRQGRVLIPAWGNGPGSRTQTPQELKARAINSPSAMPYQT